MQNTRLLDQFGVDMLERAGKREPVIGRRQEIETVLQILSRRHKNNPALIGEPGVANLLKPALGRGELQLIGATTLREYRSSIEKDAALERRFRAVQVREPTPEETREILAGLCPGLEAHHHVSIPQEVISAAVELSCRARRKI